MWKAIVWGCVLFILFTPGRACRAQGKDRDFAGISAKLFRETKDWTPVSKMKRAEAAYLRVNEPKLKEAYAADKVKSGLESEHCSFIERAFSEKYGFPRGFYIHDLNADGRPDVMYTGGAECGEGNATVVWYGTPEGWAVKQPDIEKSMVLRVKEGKIPRICSVAVACCAGVTDEYFVGELTDAGLDVERSLVVDIKTGMPVKTENLPLPFVGEASEMILRSSPARDDAYDEAMSGIMGAPVYGNVLSKYRPGCTGRVLGRQEDASSRLWYFVELDRRCGALATHDPFNANVGWVEAKEILLTDGRWMSPDYDRISALLFPETISWTVVSKMEPAGEAFLRANEAKMRAVYRASGIGDDSSMNEADSRMGRLFSAEPPFAFPRGFYLHDVDGDGRTDIIYAAHDPCSEGNVTIVWFATRDGFSIRQGTLGNVLALRLKEGKAPRMSVVSRGCCGDPIDVYTVEPLAEAPAPGGKRVDDRTQLAPRDDEAVPFAAGDTGFTLRSSSAIDDRYIGHTEELFGFPVIGNVVRRCPVGCTGKVVGRLTDSHSRLWYFVTLDSPCDSLPSPAGFDADAGWVEASSVVLER